MLRVGRSTWTFGFSKRGGALLHMGMWQGEGQGVGEDELKGVRQKECGSDRDGEDGG